MGIPQRKATARPGSAGALAAIALVVMLLQHQAGMTLFQSGLYPALSGAGSSAEGFTPIFCDPLGSKALTGMGLRPLESDNPEGDGSSPGTPGSFPHCPFCLQPQWGTPLGPALHLVAGPTPLTHAKAVIPLPPPSERLAFHLFARPPPSAA